MKKATKVGEDIQDKREVKVIEDYQDTLESMGLQVKRIGVTRVLSAMPMNVMVGYPGKYGTKGEKGNPGKRT